MAPTASKPYLLDFTYLFDEGNAEFIEFTGGQKFTAKDVFAEIGSPADWTHRARSVTKPRSEEEAIAVAKQLQACQHWEALFDFNDTNDA